MHLHRHAAPRLLSLGLLAASLLGGDCNSTDDTGSAGSAGSATSTDAVTKCTSLVDKLCTRIDTCGVQDKAGCIASNQTSLDCTKAVDVTTSYPQCVKDVDALTCDDPTVLFPSSCSAVIVLGAKGLAPGEGWMSHVGTGELSAE